MKPVWSIAFLLALAVAAVAQSPTPANPPRSQVTEINSDMGGNCSVEFRVTDLQGKALYDVRIHTLIRHGFMSQRKLELEAGTNADGLARFTHLLEGLNPVTFTITNGASLARRTWNPMSECRAHFDVALKPAKPRAPAAPAPAQSKVAENDAPAASSPSQPPASAPVAAAPSPSQPAPAPAVPSPSKSAAPSAAVAPPPKPTPKPAPGARPYDVSADMDGNCSVEFRVTDMKGNALYDAKVRAVIRHGFLSQKKVELEAGTDANGLVRFTHLSGAILPVTFSVYNGADVAKRTWDPANLCLAHFDVPLKTK